MLIRTLSEAILPGPLPRPDLTQPDDQVSWTELSAHLQRDQLWRLVDDLNQLSVPADTRLAKLRLQRIFHDQDQTLTTPGQRACLASVTRYTLILIDHAQAEQPETVEHEPRKENRPPTPGGGARSIWAGHPPAPATAETARITHHVNEIRQQLQANRRPTPGETDRQPES